MRIFNPKTSKFFVRNVFILGIHLTSCATTQKEDLFTYGERTYSAKDLPLKAQHQIYTAESDRQARLKDILKPVILDMYFKEKAAEQKTTVDAVKKKYLTMAEPTEKEKRDYLEKNKGVIPYSYDIIKDELASMMAENRQAEAEARILAEVEKTKGARYAFSLPEPIAVPITLDGFPSKGPDHANIVIVEFADFTCPYCKAIVEPLKTILKTYEGRVRLVYKYFLLHEGSSDRMAKGGYCAQKLGKFWEYYDYAFDKQIEARWKSVAETAKIIGVDAKAFQSCQDSKEASKAVTDSHNEALELGVTRTPTFFVNGKLASSGVDLAPLEASIKKAL